MDKLLWSKLAAQFGFDEDAKISSLGNGHINQTYFVDVQPPMVLQKINTHVFQNHAILMENFELVTQHLNQKKQDNAYDYEVMTLFKTTSGASFWDDGNHGLWRAFNFVENTITLEQASSTQDAFEVAFAFGEFNRALMDCSVDKFQDVIPDFHNIHVRLEQLEAAKKQASQERLKHADAVIDEAYLSYPMVVAFDMLVARGLPKRLTHNDTKINNILLATDTHKAACVIDLDTVMSGYLMYDFGDMVRTMVSTHPEDSADYEQVSVRMDMMKALIEGYLKSLGDVLTPVEQESLVLGAKLLPYIVGVRFLTDYLAGDVYFNVDYPEHNLIRAKNQFKLLESISRSESEINTMIHAAIS